MKNMLGDFNKCHGVMFAKCMTNREIRGNDREARIKNCAENCPRAVLTPEQWLYAQRENHLIVVIDSKKGEVWRNDPYYKDAQT